MLTIRAAHASDYDPFTELFLELHVDDPTPSRDAWTRIAKTSFVAEQADAVVGYIYYDLFAHECHIRHISVAAEARGHRVGQRLMERVLERMREAGLSQWALNVKPENTSAIRLYERMGMRPVYTSQAMRFDWSITERLPVDAQLTTFAIEPARDAEIEHATKLSPGQLATLRARGDNVQRAVEDASSGAVVGAAVFTPTFPGAYPFKAASAAVARTLLEALRPFARPDPPYMQVVIEGQPDVASALREAGALVRLDIVHYKGTV